MAHLRLITSVMVLAAAASGGSVTPAKSPAASRVKAPPGRSDADIEREIRARLGKSKIGADKFQVRVQGGVATLEGTTDVIQHKGVATRLAKSGGAAAVNNKIQISEAAREKAASNLEKGRRRAQVKRGEARSESTPPRANH